MIKTTSALALVGSSTAAISSSTPTTKDIRSLFNIERVISKGIPTTQSQIESATAVSGDWLAISEGQVTCSGSYPAVFSYKMDHCVEDYEGSNSTPQYNIYTCTEDSTMGTVVVTRTPYSDSSCGTSTGSGVTTSFSTSCTSGKSASCTDTNNAGAIKNAYSGGLYMAGYETSTLCNSGDSMDLVAYIGVEGCYYGLYFGPNLVTSYLGYDCTGISQGSMTYEELFPPHCDAAYDDENPYDDDDAPIYDGLYVSMTYGDEDDDAFCFHVDSKIDYKGVEYAYEELKAGKEPECTVPHSPWSKGVIISTSCGKTVRVTDTHLMATTKGFQLAYSLKTDDVLFGNYDGEMCTVKSVEKERVQQQYFGLNCVHSEVLASGLRASTFGDFHTLQSWYMTYVGGVLGTDTASYFGEYIAEWYFQKKW